MGNKETKPHWKAVWNQLRLFIIILQSIYLFQALLSSFLKGRYINAMNEWMNELHLLDYAQSFSEEPTLHSKSSFPKTYAWNVSQETFFLLCSVTMSPFTESTYSQFLSFVYWAFIKENTLSTLPLCRGIQEESFSVSGTSSSHFNQTSHKIYKLIEEKCHEVLKWTFLLRYILSFRFSRWRC